jgi:uncharacterized protein with HEPN domain
MKHSSQKYIQDILERIQRIEAFSQDGKEAFLASLMMQDAILRNFEIMGEIVKRLGKPFTEQYPDVPCPRTP